ncbi:hypothetical protein HDV57DRAFT_91907 [Trichoderma longibrachiatum]
MGDQRPLAALLASSFLLLNQPFGGRECTARRHEEFFPSSRHFRYCHPSTLVTVVALQMTPEASRNRKLSHHHYHTAEAEMGRGLSLQVGSPALEAHSVHFLLERTARTWYKTVLIQHGSCDSLKLIEMAAVSTLSLATIFRISCQSLFSRLSVPACQDLPHSRTPRPRKY